MGTLNQAGLRDRFGGKNKKAIEASAAAGANLQERVKQTMAKFAFGVNKRIAFYENLAAKVDDGLSLSDIISALGKRHRIYNDIHQARFNEWIKRLDSGASIEGMLEGWIPETEHMLIKIGASGDMAKALRLCIKLASANRDLKAKLKKALLGPVFTLLFMVGMLYGFYTGMVPILLDLMPLEDWRPFATMFYEGLKFVDDYAFLLLIASGGFAFVVFESMSKLPRSQLRSFLDKLPPWSLYRMQTAASVAVTIATSLQLGMSFSDTIAMMQKSVKQRWLESHLVVMEKRASQGFDIGNAMDTGITPREELGVSDGKGLLDKETLNDLSDFSTSSSFDTMMLKIGDRVVEQALKSMDVISGAIAFFLKVAVMFCIILMVATFMLTILDFRNSLK